VKGGVRVTSGLRAGLDAGSKDAAKMTIKL
jgi:hypothetical protein